VTSCSVKRRPLTKLSVADEAASGRGSGGSSRASRAYDATWPSGRRDFHGEHRLEVAFIVQRRDQHERGILEGVGIQDRPALVAPQQLQFLSGGAVVEPPQAAHAQVCGDERNTA
jgi:hypothetical protein